MGAKITIIFKLFKKKTAECAYFAQRQKKLLEFPLILLYGADRTAFVCTFEHACRAFISIFHFVKKHAPIVTSISVPI